jgi:DNA-binding CsgD family transcriptional regulator/PAS domain-containing protein
MENLQSSPRTKGPTLSRRRPETFHRVEAAICDASLDSNRWNVALQLLTRAVDGFGAALILRDTRTNRVRSTSFVGPGANLTSSYVEHYSKLDRYAAMLELSPPNRLMRLSEVMTPPELRTDEWYNDYLLKCGIGDLLACRIHASAFCTIVLGVHEATGRPQLAPRNVAKLNRLLKPMGRAVGLAEQLQEHGWRSSIALQSLDQLSAAVIVSDGEGRVIELNQVAERIVSRADGLSVRQGKLPARRVFETGKLEALLAATTATNCEAIRRMIVVRPNQTPYLLTITPLAPHVYGRPLALILIKDPEVRPTQEHVAELFGLSPAEGRLVVALMAGKILREIAIDLGVEIPTLRTQLSSVFRKVGVSRQTDLMRILASIPGGEAGALH